MDHRNNSPLRSNVVHCDMSSSLVPRSNKYSIHRLVNYAISIKIHLAHNLAYTTHSNHREENLSLLRPKDILNHQWDIQDILDTLDSPERSKLHCRLCLCFFFLILNQNLSIIVLYKCLPQNKPCSSKTGESSGHQPSRRLPNSSHS